MRVSRQIKKHRLRTLVIRNIEEISPEAFNKVFPHVPERYHFFKTLDESKFDQFNFYYILAYDKKQLVGAAPCFTVNYSLDTGLNGPLRHLTNGIKKLFPNIFIFKTLVCGIPMGQGQIGISGFSMAVMESIEQRIEALARKIKVPFIAFKDFDRSYEHFLNPLLKKNYLRIDGLPMTRLDLEFKDFDEYLKKLSRATRYDFRRKLKKASSVKIESSVVNSLDEAALDEIYELYLQEAEAHGIGFEIVPKDFFRLISKNMPQETAFFLFRINGKLAAFAYCLVSEGVLLDYYLGFDYTPAHEYHLYFLKFKEIMNWCLARGIKTYEMGQKGYATKRRLGFELVEVFLYVRVRHKILRICFKCLQALRQKPQ